MVFPKLNYTSTYVALYVIINLYVVVSLIVAELWIRYDSAKYKVDKLKSWSCGGEIACNYGRGGIEISVRLDVVGMLIRGLCILYKRQAF